VPPKSIPPGAFKPGTRHAELFRCLGHAGGPLTTAQVAADLGTTVRGAGRALGHWLAHDPGLIATATGPFGVPAWTLTTDAQAFYASLP
jgi:hypothetical protein